MIKTMQRGIWLMLALALAISGCGRKEAPQAIADGAIKPELTEFRHEQTGNVLQLYFVLEGAPEGVGYQIDRAEVDPKCNCLTMWRRYFEQEAMPQLVGEESTRIINLKTTKREFAFRIRAIDMAGNLSAWSPTVRARAIDLFNR